MYTPLGSNTKYSTLSNLAQSLRGLLTYLDIAICERVFSGRLGLWEIRNKQVKATQNELPTLLLLLLLLLWMLFLLLNELRQYSVASQPDY